MDRIVDVGTGDRREPPQGSNLGLEPLLERGVTLEVRVLRRGIHSAVGRRQLGPRRSGRVHLGEEVRQVLLLRDFEDPPLSVAQNQRVKGP